MARYASYVERNDPVEYADLVVDGAPTVRHDAEVEFVLLSQSSR